MAAVRVIESEPEGGMSRGQVYIVDDDVFIRQSVRDLVESVGIEGRAFGTAEAFLNAYVEDRPTSVVIDMRLPDMSGLAIQERLLALGATAPVIFVTGYGDAWTAVRAMKGGAFDFLEKPVKDQELLHLVQAAIRSHTERLHKENREGMSDQVGVFTLHEVGILMRVEPGEIKNAADEQGPDILAAESHDPSDPIGEIHEPSRAGATGFTNGGLTPRQREILMALKKGQSNKEIGRQLGIPEGTVKVHLKAIYRQLGVNNRTQAAIIANRHRVDYADTSPTAEMQ
ncbi:MAG: response regulator transcription factor [Rhodospirillales bacterium]|nr:response regulator transcription factor [Rhodospirillales bacterium]